MKLTPYIRFIVGGLYAISFFVTTVTLLVNEPFDSLIWLSELFVGLIAVIYLTFCIRQGLKELRNDNSDLTYPRILAILIEGFNIAAFIFILTQINASQLISVLPLMIIVSGMTFLFTQNVRILISKS